ncbi:MAG TPA: twin transmembrane helix small protein [Rhodospirillaceae bacterium]|nr:twin transmembrane helix small protein [Rhodospirillaceae bacterium]HRI75638.1 twin transmembrane helix small protein [Alphaproteobacteria bacterium]
MSPLSVIFAVLAGMAFLGVVASLFWGMVVMTRGREQDHKTSNRMMQFRIACQALAILFLFLAYAAK